MECKRLSGMRPKLITGGLCCLPQHPGANRLCNPGGGVVKTRSADSLKCPRQRTHGFLVGLPARADAGCSFLRRKKTGLKNRLVTTFDTTCHWEDLCKSLRKWYARRDSNAGPSA